MELLQRKMRGAASFVVVAIGHLFLVFIFKPRRGGGGGRGAAERPHTHTTRHRDGPLDTNILSHTAAAAATDEAGPFQPARAFARAGEAATRSFALT